VCRHTSRLSPASEVARLDLSIAGTSVSLSCAYGDERSEVSRISRSVRNFSVTVECIVDECGVGLYIRDMDLDLDLDRSLPQRAPSLLHRGEFDGYIYLTTCIIK
jgi:hypothetical protein